MKHIDRIFDAQQYFRRAEELLGTLTKEEKQQWLQHPCTMALMLQMEGEFLDLHEAWENGLFKVNNSVEGTAMQSESAKSQIAMIRKLAVYIEEVPND